MSTYDDITVTKHSATYDVNVQGDGPWAMSLRALMDADPFGPLNVYTSDGLTFCAIGSERFEVTGIDRAAGALILERAR